MSNAAPFLLLLLTATTAVITKADTDAGCTLDCPSDAPCTMEAADFTKHTAIGLTSEGTMHCACPPGWTGILCDKIFEACNEEHNCYHGGNCIPGLIDKYGNDQHFCDCTDAVATDGTQYVGKYCETPFDQICSNDNDDLFCVNGGECNPNYDFDGVPCNCPEGWEGFHCEFKTGTVPDCSLECGNGGTCVVGVRSPAEAEHFHKAWSQLDVSAHSRCLCPDGFGGPLCEATAEECGESDYCYHGGSCITTTRSTGGVKTTEYRCDCTTASDDDGNLFAGQFCQFVSTEICSTTDENLFCVNGGSCDFLDPVQGCFCPEGYDGFKCDIVVDPPSFDDNNGNNGDDAEQCGDVYCLNGASCTEETFLTTTGDEAKRDVCDCSQATNKKGEKFAGPACQYKETTTCDLGNGMPFCVNGGTCPLTPDDGCDCLDGWTGDQCEIHSLDEKDPQDPVCGPDGNVCLNGGKCVETQVIKQDDTVETQYHCDCSPAFDEKHLYAGESCQFPSTHLCTHPEAGESLEGHLFCTNHGHCGNNVLRGCGCPDGFTGFSCEYEVVDEDPDEPSVDQSDIDRCGDDLICHNGGKCQSTLVNSPEGGTRTIKHCDCTTAVTEDTVFAGPECQYEASSFCTLPAEGMGLESSIFCVNGGICQENVLQGCNCPTGWTGLSCEFVEEAEDILDGTGDLQDAVVACGDSFCYNGGNCNRGTCDCSTAYNDENLFAGPTCQYPSTRICTDLDEGESLLGAPFCVNHGKCKSNPQDGCDCPPHWTGNKCEVEVTDDQHAEHGDACGEGYCYNGGECVTTKIRRQDGSVDEEFHCDCSTAVTSTDLYAGESCEHKSTSFCSHSQVEGSLEGILFCVNGGTCGENPLEGCDCPPEWTGFSCEYDTPPEDIADSLDDTGAGVQDCGDIGVCLNGGECVTTTISNGDGDKTVTQHCDCSGAYTDTDLFAGPQCEFKSTSKCTAPEPDADLAGVLFCVNGGTCMENVNEGCDCPPAWTGLRCEFRAEEEDIFDDDVNFVGDYVPCGEDNCYHGGTCTAGDVSGVEECDCSTAVTDTDRYDGEFCQYKATEFCPGGVEFCTNGGRCTGHGCHCPSGYTGSRCQFPLYANQDSEDNIAPDDGTHDDDDDYQECHLQCKNDGVCAKGAKDLGDLHQTVEHVSHLNQTYSSQFFEHCVCPPEWTGLECTHKVEICGDNEHACLHGSKCVKNNKQHGCDCSVADEDLDGDGKPAFAGDSCQHPATDICLNSDDYIGRPLYFCVNHGTCRDYVTVDDDFPGCECPREWTGPHCEIRISSLARDNAKVAKTGAVIFLSVFFTILGIAVVLVASSYCLRNRSEENRTCFLIRRNSNRGRFFVDPREQRSNLAPRRNTVVDPPSTATGLTLDPDDEPDAFHDEPDFKPYSDDPVVVNIGPPRDEDGHVLHSVDFDDSESNDVI